jgi:predicted ATP-grasp superfamily ATP-dependent carboligase
VSLERYRDGEVIDVNGSTEIFSQLIRDVFRTWFWIPLLISLYFLGKYVWRSRERFKPVHPVKAEVTNIYIYPVDSEGQVVFQVNSKFVLNGQRYFSSVEGSYSIDKSNPKDRMIRKSVDPLN